MNIEIDKSDDNYMNIEINKSDTQADVKKERNFETWDNCYINQNLNGGRNVIYRNLKL